MGYLSSVCSGGQRCAGLADRNVMGFISAIHELASRERQFYCWLSSVRKLLLTPLRSKGERLSFEPLDIIDCIYYYTNKVCLFVYSAPQRVCVHHWASRALTSSFLSVRVFSIWVFWLGDTPRHLPTSCMMHRAVMSLSYHCWRTSSTFWTFIKSKVYLFVLRHKKFWGFFSFEISFQASLWCSMKTGSWNIVPEQITL